MIDPYDGREPNPERPEQAEGLARVRQTAKNFRDVLNATVPAAGREKALALTNLEQALMWAERAVVPAGVPPVRPSSSVPPPVASPGLARTEPRVPPSGTPTEGG